MKRSSFVILLIAAIVASAVADSSILSLWECNGSPDQHFEYLPNHFQQIVGKTNDLCVDIEGYGTDDGSNVYLWTPCHPEDKDPAHQNESWLVNQNGTIQAIMSKKCLDARGGVRGASPVIATCNGTPSQKWTFLNGALRNEAKGLCLDSAPHPVVGPCELEPGRSLPFCDMTLTREARVGDLVSRLTEEEKMGLFTNGAQSVPRLNIPAYQWWSEALHGVGGSPGVNFGGPVPYATSFPQIIGMGATYNRTLVNTMATVISTEARAFNNVGRAGLTFWAPNINIIRDPRWGRGQETPGEDPYLTGEYASHFVPGMQQGNDTNYLKVSSCLKHYAAYNLEDWHGVDRHHFNAIVSKQDMADTYLPAFQAGVTRGRASALMCSYNSINGVPSCANMPLLTEIARDTWGFEGYITGDCGAVDDVYSTHKYAPTTDATCADVLNAGMDVDCGGFLPAHLKAAVDDGAVSMDAVNRALRHLFMVQFRLGIFDPASIQPYKSITPAAVNTPFNQKLALDAARQSLVLLKNDGVLPLSSASVRTLAVVGPNADATSVLQGNYQGNAPYLISPIAGFSNYSKVTFVHGCDINSNDRSHFAEAQSAAANADATVIVVGLNQEQESEGHDRETISLPGVQDDFVSAVSTSAKGSVIVVVIAGGAVDLSLIKLNPKVKAIIWAGYPGQSGGQAIADVVFGTFNPSGRLPYTIYEAALVSQVSMFDMNMRPNATSGNPGRTYRFYTRTPVYEFGFGLSYTTFTENWASEEPITLSVKAVAAQLYSGKLSHEVGALVSRAITVKNTGSRAGSEAVLVYVYPPTPGQDGAPLKSLRQFEKVLLAAGESRQIVFNLNAFDFTWADENGKFPVVPGTWTVVAGGSRFVVNITE